MENSLPLIPPSEELMDEFEACMPVRVLGGRKDAVKEFMAARDIPTGVHYKPNHLLSCFGGGAESLPVTEQLYGELVTLPLHPGLSTEDVESVCDALVAALK